MIIAATLLASQELPPPSSYGPYGDCLVDTFQQLVVARPTPERMEIALKGACTRERDVFRQDSIRYFLSMNGNPGIDAVYRIVDDHIARQQSNLVGPYTFYYATGGWPVDRAKADPQ